MGDASAWLFRCRAVDAGPGWARERAPPAPPTPQAAWSAGRPRQATSRRLGWPMPAAGFRLLPDRGGVAFMVGLDEQRYGFDQGQVGECLREIAEVLACGDVDLLRVELQRSGEREQLLAQGVCTFGFADHGQRGHQPERADGEGAFLAGEPG